MNFLSHYYFDQHSDAYTVLGTVLPDLTKNAQKEWKLHPQKHPEYFSHDTHLQAILHGWNRHLIVDQLFHSSSFFRAHSHQLGKLVRQVLIGTPIKPYFLGHIGIELLLDSLLLRNNKVDIPAFYDQLSECRHEKIAQFLALSGLEESGQFFTFFERFLHNQYLTSYRQTENIAYALNRICMRIWPGGLEQARQVALSQIIHEYQTELAPVYLQIFDEITPVLQAQKIQ